MKEIEIYGDYIQLDQFLKKENMISSGGETGNFIEKHEIFVNGVIIKEKRKKIRIGDELSLDGEVYRIIGAKKRETEKPVSLRYGILKIFLLSLPET